MSNSDGPRKMTRADYNGMYEFQCSCGGKMATNGSRLDEAISDGRYFKCPNSFYGKCNKSYSAQDFKRKANFIAPIIPNGMM